MGQQRRSILGRVRARLLGDERHIGLWIFPLFVMVALLGAVLIGGLATLYYGQQVGDLQATTTRARENLDEVVDDVSQQSKKARRDISRQVNQARDEFSRDSPIQSPAGAGVYAVSATQPDGEVRVGSAFTVFSDANESYLLTTYSLIATGDGGAVDTVDLFLSSDASTVPVHSFDADRDLAVLIAEGGPLPVLDWRPPDEPVKRGDAVYAVGIAGPGMPAVVPGRVASNRDLAIVPDVPLNEFLAGGPLVDGAGRIVAISSLEYAPFGEVDGTLVYAPPIRLSCEVLVDCTAQDVGAEGAGGG